MKNPWKKLSSKIVYKNPWITVIEDQVKKPAGREGLYAYVHTPPSVFIVALTEKNEIYLVGQHRYTSGVYSLELPAGGSEDKDLLEAAKKELQEETGLKAKKWTEIGKFFPLNGVSSEITHVFIAEGLSQTNKHEQYEEGIHEMKVVPFEKALEMIKEDEIKDGQTIAALMQAQLYLQNK